MDKSGEIVIPNEEIRFLFIHQINEWVSDVLKNEEQIRNTVYHAVKNEDSLAIEKQLNLFLKNTISIRDTNSRNSLKENFYHGILLGLLEHGLSWRVKSNPETGDGYADILIIDDTDDLETAIVFELKYAHDGNLEKACDEALNQIEVKRYADIEDFEDVKEVIRYGIAFYRKRCKVKIGK
ncbi:MAG: PD-(D/E)XK nuclease domain-containing protein [Lachnospiraceae bacterium]|nr:PD-(D/E)XK nuclease domain-containing protein [Lachnospiraceae bacterium]